MAKEAIFRSAEMSLAQFYISKEVCREIVSALGELSCIEFRDLNGKVSNFQRAFVSEIRSLDNSLRQVRYIKDNLRQAEIPEAPLWEGQLPDVDDISGTLDTLEVQVAEMQAAKDRLLNRQALLIEHRKVLDAAGRFFGSQQASGGSSDDSNDDQSSGFDVVAGVIAKESMPYLERIAWRALRGNLLISSGDAGMVYDTKAKAEVEKSVFIIVTYGSELVAKATKLAEALESHTYPVSPQLCHTKLKEVNAQLAEMEVVVSSTRAAVETELRVAARSILSWETALLRDKAVFEMLNRFSYDPSRKLLVGEGWIPTDEIQRVQNTLRSVSESASVETPAVLNLLETSRTPPTFHRTNKITSAFQAMVDVYAIASYQEVNPALPTIITFPFMFAIMFGDMGHGFILAAASSLLVFNERKLAKVKGGDVFDMAFGGRYVLLFMGLFSIYTGFLYNDLFSRSLTLFTSKWSWPEHKWGETIKAVQTGVYAMGIDPAWHAASNNLLFMNSYKMKLSILMGWLHMSYSHFFSLANAIHFKSMIDIVGQFIPEILFLQGIFGYLSVCIVYKWTVDWTAEGARPPSLMNMLINMFLSPGYLEDQLFSGQRVLQIFLVVVALIAVPWLLLTKPLHFLREEKRQKQQAAYQSLPTNEAAVGTSTEEHHQQDDDDDDEEHGDHTFGDVLIHQVIHTIEFCLNCVSHTASYLRLWALSLAHAQLSQVLWNMTLALSFGMSGAVGVIMIVVMFALWGCLTVAILVAMEGTSAMLHALRLHWVESMSKFYIGEGYPFVPFTYAGLSQ